MRFQKQWEIFAIILCTLSYAAYATGPEIPLSLKDDDDYYLHIAIEPVFGVTYGEIGEHLFYKSQGNYKKISYLEWEAKPVWYGGGKLSASYKNLNGLFYLTGGIAGRSGSMYDSDWVELNDMKTDYSISENTLNSDINTGVSFSYTFNTSRRTTLSPFANFDFEYISFSAEKGYGWYADEETLTKYGYPVTHSYAYDSDMAIYFPSGSLYGVDYKRYTYSLWLGCTFSFSPLDKLTLSFSPAFSPYTWIQAIDHHHGSDGGTYYMDKTDDYFTTIAATISAEYHIDNHHSLILDLSGIKSRTIKGSTYIKYSDDSEYSKLENYKGGSYCQYVQASLGLKIQLF